MAVARAPAARHAPAHVLVGLHEVAPARDERARDVLVPPVHRPRVGRTERGGRAAAEPAELVEAHRAVRIAHGVRRDARPEVLGEVEAGPALPVAHGHVPVVAARPRPGMAAGDLDPPHHLLELLVRRVAGEVFGRDPVAVAFPAFEDGDERHAGEVLAPVVREPPLEDVGAVEPLAVEAHHGGGLARPGGQVGTVEELHAAPLLAVRPVLVEVGRVVPGGRRAVRAREAARDDVVALGVGLLRVAEARPAEEEVAVAVGAVRQGGPPPAVHQQLLRVGLRVVGRRVEAARVVVEAAELRDEVARIVPKAALLPVLAPRAHRIAEHAALRVAHHDAVVDGRRAEALVEREERVARLEERPARLRRRGNAPDEVRALRRDGADDLVKGAGHVAVDEPHAVRGRLGGEGLRVARRGDDAVRELPRRTAGDLEEREARHGRGVVAPARDDLRHLAPPRVVERHAQRRGRHVGPHRRTRPKCHQAKARTLLHHFAAFPVE